MTTNPMWFDKPYYSLDAYFKQTYGEKCYKISLDGGFTCPNRDGTIGFGGCIFCSGSGSGDFATSAIQHPSIPAQIEHGLSLMGSKKTGAKYVAYFQAFTNTYGPIAKLRKLYTEALDSPMIIGLSIGTRPDCLGEDVLALLSELKQTYPDKFIWIELGLQTIHEDTANFIRRGYPLEIFNQAARALHRIEIPFIVHVILGLPGETKSMILETIDYLNQIRPFGIKLQLLHILKGTDLATEYTLGSFEALSEETYFDILGACICRLSPDIVIHRITGDGPKNLLIAPLWSANKRGVLNHLHHYFKNHNIYQGKDFYDSGTIDSL
jgi:radical SAM protein (TIGR01212 family)